MEMHILGDPRTARIRIIEILMDEITHRQGFTEKESSCEHLAIFLLNISIYPQISF